YQRVTGCTLELEFRSESNCEMPRIWSQGHLKIGLKSEPFDIAHFIESFDELFSALRCLTPSAAEAQGVIVTQKSVRRQTTTGVRTDFIQWFPGRLWRPRPADEKLQCALIVLILTVH